MSDISPSVWNQDEKGEWKLYFNNESDLTPSSALNIEQLKLKKNFNTSQMKLVLGTLVMTPKGIGRFIKNNDGIAIIKFKQDSIEEKFSFNDISNYFNCFIYSFSKGNTEIIRLKLKVLGKVEDIFTELEKIKKIDQNEYTYNLIYKKNLLKNEYTFEQLDILNNAKFLISGKSKVAYTVSRYINIRQFWFLCNLDGICFSPSKKIKLIGVGLYGSHENKIISGIIKKLDGPSAMNETILEQNIEISPSDNKLGAITQIYFSKPVFCKQNQDYSVIFIPKVNSNVFYGTNGKAYIDGEKGVGFSFKKLKEKSARTGIESGNFPELYYNIH